MDTGAAPGCVYGSTTQERAEIALAIARIVAESSGEALTVERLDHAMGLVVNSHDDVGTLLVAHGDEHGYPASDYLDSEDIARYGEMVGL